MTNTKDNSFVSFALRVLSISVSTGIVLGVVYWWYVKDLAVLNMQCM